MNSHDHIPAIEVGNLVKSYPGGRGRSDVCALDGLNMTADTGTVFGLLGPNGAGKSTAVKILATLTRADSGSASVAGIDVAKQPERVRHAIGFVAQKQVGDPKDTGRENLVLAGRLQGMKASDAKVRASQLLDRFSLTEAADRLVKTYSGGMARKLDVAIGLMHRPKVLFLDEPTTGLDPEARADMWAEIEFMARAEQMTILLTTHYLEEAEALSQRVVVLGQGRVLGDGSVDAMRALVASSSIRCRTTLEVENMRRWPNVQQVSREGDYTVLISDQAEDVLRRLLQADAQVADLEVRRAGLAEAMAQMAHPQETAVTKEAA